MTAPAGLVRLQARREAWIAAAAEATTAAAERIETHRAASVLAVRVSAAATALHAHRTAEQEQLHSLHDELARCQSAQRRQ